MDRAAAGGAASGFGLFVRRWLADPLQMGAMLPSAPALCGRVAGQVRRRPGEWVVELGAGTGAVSRALLASGVPAERITLVEIVPELAAFLRRDLPGVEVIEGDARALASLLPRARHGRIGTVICGIPLVMVGLRQQRRFVAAMAAVAPGRGFLHYSYCLTSPLPARKLGLVARREAWTPLNLPPASVWRYQPAPSAGESSERGDPAGVDRPFANGERTMVNLSSIPEHAEVIGADGVHVGTVDHVDGHRLKLTKQGSGDAKHHYISAGLIAEVEGNTVRLSANADVAVTLEEDA